MTTHLVKTMMEPREITGRRFLYRSQEGKELEAMMLAHPKIKGELRVEVVKPSEFVDGSATPEQYDHYGFLTQEEFEGYVKG